MKVPERLNSGVWLDSLSLPGGPSELERTFHYGRIQHFKTSYWPLTSTSGCRCATLLLRAATGAARRYQTSGPPNRRGHGNYRVAGLRRRLPPTQTSNRSKLNLPRWA